MITVFKCSKCSYKGSFKQVRSHYKTSHSKRAQTKSQEKKTYIYRPPKGFKNGRRVK